MTEVARAQVGVLVVDDQDPFRRAMAAVVDETDGFAVVGVVASGEESVAGGGELQPDLVLMDVNLPGIDGIEAARADPRADAGSGGRPAVDLRRGRVRPVRVRCGGVHLQVRPQPGTPAAEAWSEA